MVPKSSSDPSSSQSSRDSSARAVAPLQMFEARPMLLSKASKRLKESYQDFLEELKDIAAA